jgi:titin
MHRVFHWGIVTITVLGFFTGILSCGGEEKTDIRTASLDGTWLMSTSITDSTCGAEGFTEFYPICIIQNGSQITVEGPHGFLTGTATSGHSTWTGQYYHKDEQVWVTITFLDVIYDDNGFSGVLSWENRLTRDGNVICSGSSNISGGRPAVPLPARPTNLTASSSSSSSIRLTWMDESSNEDGFRIYRLAGSPAHRTLVASVGANIASYDVQALLANTPNAFEITAFNNTGESLPSNKAHARTYKSGSPPPAAPSGIQVLPINSGTIRVGWQDNSADEEEFRIYRGSTSGTIEALVGSVTTDSTYWDDTDVDVATTYYYEVRSYSTAGGESDPTTVASGITYSPEGLWSYSIQGFITSACGSYGTNQPISVSGTATIVEGLPGQIQIQTGSGTLGGSYLFGGNGYIVFGLSGTMATSAGTVYMHMMLEQATLDWMSMNLYGVGMMLLNGCDMTPVQISFGRVANSQTPSAPTDLSASPATTSIINLFWIDNSTNEDGFYLYRGLNSASLTKVATLGRGSEGYTDWGLDAGTEYFYAVRAYNAYGESDSTQTVNARTLPAPASVPEAPSNLVAIPISPTIVELNWQVNSNNEEGYRIFRGTDPGNLSGRGHARAAQDWYVDYSVSPGSTYYYQVEAFNGAGESDRTPVVNVTTSGPASVPTAPSDLAATAISDTEIGLTWRDNSSNEDGFRIWSSTGCTSSWSDLGTVNRQTTSTTISNLAASTSYCFRIKSFNGSGNSTQFSNTASATTYAANQGPGSGTYTPTYDNLVYLNDYDASQANTAFPGDFNNVGNNFSIIIDPTTGAAIACYRIFFASLLRFDDINPDIAGKTITRAVLKLHPNIAPTDRPAIYNVNAIYASWNPSTVTWNDTVSNFFYTTPVSTANSSGRTDLALEWDVTAIVENWANGTWTNNGLLVWEPDNICPSQVTERATQFMSLEFNAGSWSQPKLYIEWQ